MISLKLPHISSALWLNPNFYALQGWPITDIGRFEALVLLCSYENRTGETIDPRRLESGGLKLLDLLTQEDFDKARSVCKTLLIFNKLSIYNNAPQSQLLQYVFFLLIHLFPNFCDFIMSHALPVILCCSCRLRRLTKYRQQKHPLRFSLRTQ